MSETGPTPAPNEPAESARRRGGIFDRWGNRVWAIVVLAVIGGVGTGAYLLGTKAEKQEVLVEAADTVGPDPFTTSGIRLAASSQPLGTASPGLFGGSGDNGSCDPEQLVAFLQANPEKAKAWVDALNADPKLSWKGGDSLDVGDIPAYVAELRPAVLAADTRLTNHGFKNGKATPRQSVLKKGTAVLVDSAGDPRVRCYCGNPLHPAGHSTPVSVSTPSASPSASVSPSPSPSVSPSVSPSSACDPNAPETDGCGPEPGCESLPPMPAAAAQVTSDDFDYDNDGSPELKLIVYEVGGVWHVRAESFGVGRSDQVIPGPGPMSAIGWANVNNDGAPEAWVKVGTGASTNLVGLFTFVDCRLARVTLNGDPATFPVGTTSTHTDGLSCFGFDVGIAVATATSTDGTTYTGTSTIYTMDMTTSPVSLVAGSTSNESASTSDGGSWDLMSSFMCDDLTTIP